MGSGSRVGSSGSSSDDKSVEKKKTARTQRKQRNQKKERNKRCEWRIQNARAYHGNNQEQAEAVAATAILDEEKK